MRSTWYLFCFLLVANAVGIATLSADVLAADDSRPNVLFIVIDDLRPALGCYDDPVAISPNIDSIAARGTVFRRAYCQQAVCCPSRLSFLTGMRPDRIQVWDLATHFRAAMPSAITLPQYFRQHGYQTQSVGKILHGSGKPSKDPPSWSIPPTYDYVRDPKLRYGLPKNLDGKGHKRAASESAAVGDGHYIDGVVCEAAIEALDGLGADAAAGDAPFFLAVGFRKPHLPFCAPTKYWDLYDRADIPAPVNGDAPLHAPELAIRSWRELEGYSDIPKDGKLTAAQTQELRHGYYACVSYVDSLVGKLMASLDASPAKDNTLIVLLGDHGFHLGEQGLWTKANNYELSTRVPLIVAAPAGFAKGATCDALVEFVDVYPTIAELSGLSGVSEPAGLDGTSFVPLLKDASQPWKTAVYSQYPRATTGNRHRGRGDVMGYAVRTETHRYVEWLRWSDRTIVARELYDHRSDPIESTNIADRPESRSTISRLAELLRAQRERLPAIE